MFYTFGGIIVRFILFIIGGRFQVQNKNKIPSAPFVLVATHTSWIEIIYLGLALGRNQIHFMAKQELFKKKILRWLIIHLNAFPVNRENPGPSSIKAPIKLLKEGKVVGIFPSGTRKSLDLNLKKGAVTIASKAKVPILPVVYEGPRTFKDILKRKKTIVRFGDPIHLEVSSKNQNGTLPFQADDLLFVFQSLQKEIGTNKNKTVH